MRHRIIHQVYDSLKSVESVPQDIQDRLRQLDNNTKVSLLALTGETIRLSDRLNKLNINYVMLKGVLLGSLLYSGTCFRHCKDIDLWISPDDLDKVVILLQELGYIQTIPDINILLLDKEAYFNKHNDITFFNQNRKVQVELHLKNRFFNLFFPDLLEVETKQVFINGISITTLVDEYHMLYLMLHGTKHGWLRLRWLHDIYMYIKANKVDLIKVYELSKTIKAEAIVECTLILVNNVYNISNIDLQFIIKRANFQAKALSRYSLKILSSDYDYEVNPSKLGVNGFMLKIAKFLIN